MAYVGTADIELPPDLGGTEPTEWAPEVVTGPDGMHHLYLAVVPGIFEDWEHPRMIGHLTSSDLRTWRHAQTLKLASDRVIDPHSVAAAQRSGRPLSLHRIQAAPTASGFFAGREKPCREAAAKRPNER